MINNLSGSLSLGNHTVTFSLSIFMILLLLQKERPVFFTFQNKSRLVLGPMDSFRLHDLQQVICHLRALQSHLEIEEGELDLSLNSKLRIFEILRNIF